MPLDDMTADQLADREDVLFGRLRELAELADRRGDLNPTRLDRKATQELHRIRWRLLFKDPFLLLDRNNPLPPLRGYYVV